MVLRGVSVERRRLVGLVGAAAGAALVGAGKDRPAPYRYYLHDVGTEGTWRTKARPKGVVKAKVAGEGEELCCRLTGKRAGTTHLIIYHAPVGAPPSEADSAYALDVVVAPDLSVSETQPPFGAYEHTCSRLIAGGERWLELSDEGVVHWWLLSEHEPLDGDGMSDTIDTYRFTGAHPGTTWARIVEHLPWAPEHDSFEDRFLLVVADDLVVTRRDVPSLSSFELREWGSSAEVQVFEGSVGEWGEVELASYVEHMGTSGRTEERRRTLDIADDLLCALTRADVMAWDGFAESDPYALDGYGFSFTLRTLDDKVVSASGTNAFPTGYASLKSALSALLSHGEPARG